MSTNKTKDWADEEEDDKMPVLVPMDEDAGEFVWVIMPLLPRMLPRKDLQRGEAYAHTSATLLQLLAGPIIYIDASYDVSCKALTQRKTRGSFRSFHHAAHAPGCPFAKPAVATPAQTIRAREQTIPGPTRSSRGVATSVSGERQRVRGLDGEEGAGEVCSEGDGETEVVGPPHDSARFALDACDTISTMKRTSASVTSFSADRGLHVSNDGARVLSQYNNVRPQKRRRGLEDLPDVYGAWMPVPEHDLDAVHAVADTVSSYDVSGEDADNQKRKRYPSSDPMSLWLPMAESFLDALLRRDGLGVYIFSPACSCCKAPLEGDTRLFRCTQCGEFLQCRDCLLSRHALTPLHSVQEWNGQHWIAARLSGGEGGLGLVYQVGHHGFPCEFPGRERAMVVLDLSGVHKITYRFCECAANYHTGMHGTLRAPLIPRPVRTLDTLETFRLLNVVGNMNVQDFVGTLERKTDPLRVGEVPMAHRTQDRYKSFGYMARQYGFELCAKRTGCGHTENGITKATPGAFTVACWPCPHDKNLPEGWRDVESRY
ncbi:hypothetical protein C8F04DRAFT_1205123, partial [Mycena alexandri]